MQRTVHKLAAHQAVTPAPRVDAGIAEAVERQTHAMRELSRRAFPEAEVSSDDQLAPVEVARVQRRRTADATRAATVRRARAERNQQSGAAAAPDSASARPTA